MKPNEPPTHVFYHADCLDGFGAAWAVHFRWPNAGIFFKAVRYSDPLPSPGEDARVLVVDFSWTRSELERLNKNVSSLLVLDHHASAENNLKGQGFAKFDVEQSGAMMAWKEFHGENEPPEIIRYIQDRDLWKFELPESREFSAALRSYPMDFDTWDYIWHLADMLREEGRGILRFQNQMVSVMCRGTRFIKLDGHAVPVANATCFFSEVGEELCRLFPDAPFSAYYFDRPDGIRQWGLRSRGEFDVSKVAEKFGGGGHPGAAGFEEKFGGVTAPKPVEAKPGSGKDDDEEE